MHYCFRKIVVYIKNILILLNDYDWYIQKYILLCDTCIRYLNCIGKYMQHLDKIEVLRQGWEGFIDKRTYFCELW